VGIVAARGTVVALAVTGLRAIPQEVTGSLTSTEGPIKGSCRRQRREMAPMV